MLRELSFKNDSAENSFRVANHSFASAALKRRGTRTGDFTCTLIKRVRMYGALADPGSIGAASQKFSIIHALLLYEETVKAMLVPSGEASGTPTAVLVVHSCETWPSDEM